MAGQETGQQANLRNLIAACAAVCVFAFSLGEMFPLLALTMDSWGVGPRMIGLNTAMAPVGILVAGVVIPRLSHRFGARRLAIIMALATSAVVLCYPSMPSLWAWFPLRLLQGLCAATLFALSEAWILGNAAGAWRGRVVGIYATCLSVTFGIGPAVIGWTGIEGYLPYLIGAAVLALAALPISLVSEDAGGSEDHPHVSVFRFALKAPLLLFAIGIHAMFDGGMLGFLSVYGVRLGMSLQHAALAVTAISFGNVVFQFPIGWIADHTSKWGTMMACFIVTAMGLAALPFAIGGIWVWPLLLVIGAGGFGIYTVGLAELGDRFTGADLIAGTAAFSTVWGLGALIGSVLCGIAMDVAGPHGFPGVLLLVFCAYITLQGVQAVLRRIRPGGGR